jgi:hypothetical protein
MKCETSNDVSPTAVTPRNKSKVEQLTDSAIEQLRQELECGHSDCLKRWLTAMSRFHRYSWTNVLLISFQMPTATHVAGFHTWRTCFKRFVKKGEKGIMIMAPVTRRIGVPAEQLHDTDKEEICKILNVKPVYVFDVTQTEGEPLPEFAAIRGDPSTNSIRLKDYVLSHGITVEYADNLFGADGVSCGGKILLRPGLSVAAEFSTLIHEYAHERLHDTERRKTASKTVCETEAEAVAFVVCHAIGLQTGSASSDYIQLYRGSNETLAESLQLIRALAHEIITAVQSKTDFSTSDTSD